MFLRFIAVTILSALLIGGNLPYGQEKGRDKGKDKEPPPVKLTRKGDKRALEAADRASDAYGGSGALALFRQKGQLRGILKIFTDEDTHREGSITIRFKRTLGKMDDFKRVDIELPGAPILSIGYDGEKIWGAENGQPTVLRLRAEQMFQLELINHYETLLRNRELVHELKYVGREKRSGIEVDIIDLVAGSGTPLRNFVSTKTSRVLRVEYDVALPRDERPIRIQEAYFDFRVVQNTLAPYRVERYENDRRVQEIQFTEIAFGIAIDDAVFKSADDLKSK
ncbi:MAG: hypothetical protein HY650_03240 [Acidobacteria bacterium]|nr:hypothetical protein [Acidobacteriota bacterium]